MKPRALTIKRIFKREIFQKEPNQHCIVLHSFLRFDSVLLQILVVILVATQ